MLDVAVPVVTQNSALWRPDPAPRIWGLCANFRLLALGYRRHYGTTSSAIVCNTCTPELLQPNYCKLLQMPTNYCKLLLRPTNYCKLLLVFSTISGKHELLHYKTQLLQTIAFRAIEQEIAYRGSTRLEHDQPELLQAERQGPKQIPGAKACCRTDMASVSLLGGG